VAHADAWGPVDRGRLAQVDCPVHVVLGDHDNLLAVREVERLAGSCPGPRRGAARGGARARRGDAERVVAAVARA
jgi:pimeloyl-ACP methyl ester carboxylesterase